MEIRKFQDNDTNQIVFLFYDTVHSVNALDYTTEQLNAWAPKNERDIKLQSWNKSLSDNMTYVAEINGQILGFSDMTYDGYLDRLYIHKDFQNQGIATALVNKLESIAKDMKFVAISTKASITAKPFFMHRGYKEITAQTVKRKGIELTNFSMIKKLATK